MLPTSPLLLAIAATIAPVTAYYGLLGTGPHGPGGSKLLSTSTLSLPGTNASSGPFTWRVSISFLPIDGVITQWSLTWPAQIENFNALLATRTTIPNEETQCAFMIGADLTQNANGSTADAGCGALVGEECMANLLAEVEAATQEHGRCAGVEDLPRWGEIEGCADSLGLGYAATNLTAIGATLGNTSLPADATSGYVKNETFYYHVVEDGNQKTQDLEKAAAERTEILVLTGAQRGSFCQRVVDKGDGSDTSGASAVRQGLGPVGVAMVVGAVFLGLV